MPERGDQLGIELGFVQQEQLRFRQDGGEGIGQVVAQLREGVFSQG